MSHARITRRRLLGAMGAAGALAVLPACKRSGGDPGSGSAGGGGGSSGKVKIGLVVPQSGVYATVGNEIKHGWELWLDGHGGKLGNREVITVVADEGETPQTGVPAVQKLLQSDQVDAIVGIISSAIALGAKDLVAEAKKLMIIANAGAGAITGAARSPYIWRTSFTNAQVASVMGKHLAGKPDVGPVYLIAPDYAAGAEVIRGFKTAFEAGGGKIAGEAKPAFGKTQDYQPFLTGIQGSGAKATFCFFAGAEAIAFVKQYAQFGLSSSIPLYGSGFLTEGSAVLAAQGDAAVGIQTTLHYSPELDNPANKAFVAAWKAKYGDTPAVYAVQGWDAASVLNRALAATTALDGDSLAKAMGAVGTIDDSPRGPWSFDGQSPKQKMYLRKVEKRGAEYVNTVAEDLGDTPPVA
ncbi:MAG TPA: ABC transporter substrate-binding protein [Kofleriaceae bacterium]|jgi:branched-chain amino acid transport system substrate-binding protein|nr:ABC transporter substrate-binding protein [Kofleriaceae bacterium]